MYESNETQERNRGIGSALSAETNFYMIGVREFKSAAPHIPFQIS